MNDQVTREETTALLRLAEDCLAVTGDYVELGCYRGDTSVLLGKLLAKYAKTPETCEKPVQNSTNSVDNQCKTHSAEVENSCKTSETLCKTCAKRLWIYDSFAGLPEKTREDASGAGANFQKGELFVTKREVVDKIRHSGLHNVMIKKAWFDNLTDHDLPERIAFAFCDGDLYSSIKTSLRLVEPRLSQRGIIIVHDYNNPELPGSSRAVDEFLRAHREYRLQIRYSLAILHKEC